MKHSVFLFCFLATVLSYGQQLTIRDKLVDTLCITSSAGDRESSNFENYVIAFNSSKNKYQVVEYGGGTETKYEGQKNITLSKKTFHGYGGKIVPNRLLDSLLGAITHFTPPQFSDLGLTIHQFKTITNLNRIKKTARRYQLEDKFNFYYKANPANDSIINAIKNPANFNLYLATNFDTSNTRGPEYFDYSEITIVAGNVRFACRGASMRVCKQPWNSFGRYHVNLKINRFLLPIMPPGFYRRQTLKLSGLIDDYIRWYLKKII